MKVSIILLAIWSLLLPYASAAGHSARGRDLMPHIRAIEDRVFNGPNGMPAELGALQTEYGTLPDGDQKEALGVVLKAVSANPSASAHVLFSDHLDREVAAAAGRITKGIRKGLLGNEPLARALDSIHDQLWHGESRFHPAIVFDGSPEFPTADLPKADLVRVLPDGQRLNVAVAGAEMAIPPDQARLSGPIVDPHRYDTIIVGAGYSGLAAAWWLRDLDNLIIERAPSPGGLAYQGKTRRSHLTYARGAAYVTEFEDEVKEITDSVGLGDIKGIAIPGRIDNFFIPSVDRAAPGRLILDPWEDASRSQIDAGAYRFKEELERIDKEGFLDFDLVEDIPDKAKHLDLMTARQYLGQFGSEFLPKFLDSYAQSAQGAHLDQLGALGFLLFYSSEITTRFTWPGGTGGGSYIMARKLWELHHNMFRTRSRVRRVVNTPDGVEVTYERDGKLRVVRARTAILTVPLKVAAKIVPEMSEAKRALVQGMQYADYYVHSLFTPRHYPQQGYDTWFPSGAAITDIIDGLWMATGGHARPHAGVGILDLYAPKAPPYADGRLTMEQTADDAARAAWEARMLVPELAGERELTAEANRWVSSIHLTPPGFLTRTAPQLVHPDGNIHYAGNNLGTPAFETSLVSGKRAAEAVREALEKSSKR